MITALVTAAVAGVVGLTGTPVVHPGAPGQTGPKISTKSVVAPKVLSGTGWATETVDFGGGNVCPIDSLKHNQTYTITFTDAASRTRLDPYALNAARQLNTLPSITGAGIHFAVTTVLAPLAEPAGAQYPAASPPAYHISLSLRQSPQSGMSWTTPGVEACQYAYGADIWITPEYWSSTHWFSTNATVNTVRTLAVVPHEIGHAMGLDHPDISTLPAGSVVPLMHPTTGGYQTVTAGTQTPYTPYDIAGVNQLVKNGA